MGPYRKLLPLFYYNRWNIKMYKVIFSISDFCWIIQSKTLIHKKKLDQVTELLFLLERENQTKNVPAVIGPFAIRMNHSLFRSNTSGSAELIVLRRVHLITFPETVRDALLIIFDDIFCKGKLTIAVLLWNKFNGKSLTYHFIIKPISIKWKYKTKIY